MNRSTTLFLCAIALASFISPNVASAHFPWLVVDSEGHARLFFGEGLNDRAYHLPPSIAAAKITYQKNGQDETLEIKTAEVDTDDFVGLISKESFQSSGVLNTNVTYGIYHGNRLDYVASHCVGVLPKKATAVNGDKKGVVAQVIDTDTGVDVLVFIDGAPAKDIEVSLYCSDGEEEGKATTDQEGRVSFSDQQVEPGVNAVRFGQTLDGASGDLDGEKYEATMRYCTVTFNDPEGA